MRNALALTAKQWYSLFVMGHICAPSSVSQSVGLRQPGQGKHDDG